MGQPPTPGIERYRPPAQTGFPTISPRQPHLGSSGLRNQRSASSLAASSSSEYPAPPVSPPQRRARRPSASELLRQSQQNLQAKKRADMADIKTGNIEQRLDRNGRPFISGNLSPLSLTQEESESSSKPVSWWTNDENKERDRGNESWLENSPVERESRQGGLDTGHSPISQPAQQLPRGLGITASARKNSPIEMFDRSRPW